MDQLRGVLHSYRLRRDCHASTGTNTNRCRLIMPSLTETKHDSSLAVSTYTAPKCRSCGLPDRSQDAPPVPEILRGEHGIDLLPPTPTDLALNTLLVDEDPSWSMTDREDNTVRTCPRCRQGSGHPPPSRQRTHIPPWQVGRAPLSRLSPIRRSAAGAPAFGHVRTVLPSPWQNPYLGGS